MFRTFCKLTLVLCEQYLLSYVTKSIIFNSYHFRFNLSGQHDVEPGLTIALRHIPWLTMLPSKHILQILLAKLTNYLEYNKSIVCFSHFTCKICLFLDISQVRSDILQAKLGFSKKKNHADCNNVSLGLSLDVLIYIRCSKPK